MTVGQAMSRLAVVAFAVSSAGCTASRRSPSTTMPSPPPATVAALGPWAAAVARRAGEIVSSSDRWNHADTVAACPAGAQTFSIYCALQRATDEALLPRTKEGEAAEDTIHGCLLRAVGRAYEGSCGLIFHNAPVFTLNRVPAIGSGEWRADMRPTAVWAGAMIYPGDVLFVEARQVVDTMAARRYAARIVDYNNDSTTTFADVRRFFRVLQDRAAHPSESVLQHATDSIVVENYIRDTSIIRTPYGWFFLSGFAIPDSTLVFQIHTSDEVPPSGVDRRILRRATEILSSPAVWNRADNRKCPVTAQTWSIYCALERASVQVAGGFHHRRPAMQLVRGIVDERAGSRGYHHRLMDYNNDSTTRFSDVRSLFAQAIHRIRQ